MPESFFQWSDASRTLCPRQAGCTTMVPYRMRSGPSRWTSPWFWLSAAVCLVVFVFYTPVARCPTCEGCGQDLDDKLRLVAAHRGAPWDKPCATCSGVGRLTACALLGKPREPVTPTVARCYADDVSATTQGYATRQSLGAVVPDTKRIRVQLNFLVSNETDHEQTWVNLDLALVDTDGVVRHSEAAGLMLTVKPGHKQPVETTVDVPTTVAEAAPRVGCRIDLFSGSDRVGSCPIDFSPLGTLEKPKPPNRS